MSALKSLYKRQGDGVPRVSCAFRLGRGNLHAGAAGGAPPRRLCSAEHVEFGVGSLTKQIGAPLWRSSEQRCLQSPPQTERPQRVPAARSECHPPWHLPHSGGRSCA